MDVSNEQLKARVRDFWNELSCDTQVAAAEKFSLPYFEQIEAFRYRDQPFIHGFAQFTRYRGKRVLEVGFGAGTDFIQWLRAGAQATGIDLTPEALENLSRRIAVYGLPDPEKITVADAENLPFPSNTFDLGYSFGVLHHSPDTEKAIAELVRVVRPGGEIKIMLYNRHSIYVVNRWVRFALLRGKPWRSLTSVLWNNIESVGTKGYTRSELKQILGKLPLRQIVVQTETTSGDYLSAAAAPFLNAAYRMGLRLAGSTYDWHASDYVERPAPGDSAVPLAQGYRELTEPQFFGNRLGFYHCISARKAPIGP